MFVRCMGVLRCLCDAALHRLMSLCSVAVDCCDTCSWPSSKRVGRLLQVEVVSPEAYAYDGECIAKAEELGKPGLVDIRPLPVSTYPDREFAACSRDKAFLERIATLGLILRCAVLLMRD